MDTQLTIKVLVSIKTILDTPTSEKEALLMIKRLIALHDDEVSREKWKVQDKIDEFIFSSGLWKKPPSAKAIID